MEREPRYGRYWDRDEEESYWRPEDQRRVYRGPLRHARDWREVEHSDRWEARHAPERRRYEGDRGRDFRRWLASEDERYGYGDRGFEGGRWERRMAEEDRYRRGARWDDREGYRMEPDERGSRMGGWRDDEWTERERSEEGGLAGRITSGIRGFFRGERGPHRGKGPKGYRRSDERIREDVCECIAETGWVDASDVEVRVQDGEVTLSGTVDERRDKRLLEDLAEDVPGVRDVHNQIRVRRERERGMGAAPGRYD